MPLDHVVRCATDLAATVGPLETLVAMSRLEDALDDLDGELDDGDTVIDLRETREVLIEIEPVLAGADARIADLRSALEGR